MLSVHIDTLTFNDGTTISVPASGVTLVVGPNSSGKSQILRDIRTLAVGADTAGIVLSSLTLTKQGTDSEFGEHLRSTIKPRSQPHGQPTYNTGEFTLDLDTFKRFWTSHDRLQYVGALFVLLANAESRLSESSPVSSIDPERDPAIHTFQKAYEKPSIEREIDDLCFEAFGAHAVLDRYTSGSVLRFRIGDRPVMEVKDNILTNDFMEKMRSLVPLEHQGDGVKSFIGLMLQVVAGSQMIILVDEPEAFLHPPQARLVGSRLAKRATHGRQLVCATHSSDVVLGALNSGEPVTIVRLSRHGSINIPAQLKHEDVALLWSDPVLRFSNLFDALFHDAVILCEGDGDCRFYSAVIGDLLDERDERQQRRGRRPEILFTHCNGKGGMAKVARALRAVKLSVFVLPDFDIFQTDGECRSLIEALDGNVVAMMPRIRKLQSYLNSSALPTKNQVIEQLTSRLNELPDVDVTAKSLESVVESVKPKTRWKASKHSGYHGLPAGELTSGTLELLDELKAWNLHVVPTGEMESFIKQVGGHAHDWLNEVFERKLHLDRSNTALREFLTGVLDGIEAAASNAS